MPGGLDTMKQLSLFSRWTPGTIRPAPGQTVLLVYEKEDGTPSEIIIATPVHQDETDYPVLHGRPFLRPTLWWMALPDHPVSKK